MHCGIEASRLGLGYFLGASGNISCGMEGLKASFSNDLTKRMIEFATRIIQSTCASYTLILMGRLTSHPAVTAAGLLYIVPGVIVPSYGVVYWRSVSSSPQLKKFISVIDTTFNLMSKGINLASVGYGLIVFTPPVVYVPSIIALTALNLYVVCR